MRTILLILFLLSLKVSGQTINSSQIIFSDLKTCESPSRSAYSSYYKGLEMITNQQWNRAINNFKKAVEKDSTFCGAWGYLSYSYWKNGDLEKSKNNTITSLKINPYNPSALLMKGY